MISPAWGVAAAAVLLLGLGLFVLAASLRRPRERRCPACQRVLLAGWTRCRFCGAAVEVARAELEFVSGPLIGQSVGLEREITTIGSVAGNTVLLADTGVSKRHVGIRRVGATYELADLGSTNGVYVNGERVARRQLAVGDVIRVGSTEIVFRT
jgi:hypothetical protein